MMNSSLLVVLATTANHCGGPNCRPFRLPSPGPAEATCAAHCLTRLACVLCFQPSVLADLDMAAAVLDEHLRQSSPNHTLPLLAICYSNTLQGLGGLPSHTPPVQLTAMHVQIAAIPAMGAARLHSSLASAGLKVKCL